ncbi:MULTISPECIES: hypothetical protein [Burkholderia]|uniref:hypothetical protein n=1 Tax=Burkholderia TaxID=32008 RepID=UPI001178C0CD|nr:MULTISPECIES: hypothetical protein [Burkholderia]MBY4725193.1 hypothetical protein [Burkholderia contaminans]MCI3970793.1 hypothetical protein [Burkholderia sp. HI4860]
MSMILPNGKTQFEDANGRPLIGGQVYFYQPSTETKIDTWQDIDLTIPNTNPVELDARGQAPIWGNTVYRQVVKDRNGLVVWDAVVAAAMSFADFDNGAATNALKFDGVSLTQLFKGRVNRVVNSVAELRSLSSLVYQRAFAAGYYRPHDDGGGAFQVDPDDESSLDNGCTIIVAADGARWKLQLTGPLSLKQAGAYGDGIAGSNTGHDDTAAIQRWLNVLSPTLAGYMPPGVYNVSATVTKVGSNISILTAGAANSIINWIGAATDQDSIRFGDGTTTCSYWCIGGIGFESSVKMTAGAGVHLKKFMVRNSVEEFSCGMISKNDKMYHGAWLDVVNVFYLTTMNATMMVDGLRLNGSGTDDSGSDLFLTRGNISFCVNGLHQGGGFGGLRTGQLNSFNNGINYLFDTTIAAWRNREIFYEAGSVCDGATVAGVVFDDALTSNAPVTLAGFIGSSGQLGPGAGPFHGVWVKRWPNGRFNVSSGQIFNHKGNAFHIDDVSIVMSISAESHIFNNSGWGVYASSRWYNCYYWAGYVANNVLGDFHPNTGCANGTTYTPTITAQSGALGAYTATLRWSTNGKTATWTLFASITNIGTASGPLSIQLPFQVRLSVAVTGVDAQNNLSVHGYLSSNTSIEFVSKYDGSFAAANGSVLVFSGNCEIQ